MRLTAIGTPRVIGSTHFWTGWRMLSEDDFRATVLEKVHDTFLLRYWRDEFEKMRPQLRSEAVAPVQTRLAYFASSKRPREILGQTQLYPGHQAGD